MDRLMQLVGTWFVLGSVWGEDGAWQAGTPTKATIVPIVKGRMLRENGEYSIPGRWFEPETIFSYDPFRHLYRIVTLDETMGLLDVYEGTFEGAHLVLTNERAQTWFVRPDGTSMKFRLTYTLGKDRVSMLIEESPSDAFQWHPFIKFEYTRTDG